jgi:hypothetical protein
MRDFGGRKVRIPRDTFAHERARERRNRRIVEALRRGTYHAVAHQFHISKATVERVAKSNSVCETASSRPSQDNRQLIK